MGRLDGAGAPLMRLPRRVVRIARTATLAGAALFLAAHVGSPDTVLEGRAGAYPVRVVVRAPEVIPARAQVTVRVTGSGVTRVSAAPYIWNGGDAGAPPPDALVRVPGDGTLWTGELWIMRAGSYSIRVTVDGAAGGGTLAVPFVAAPQRVLTMDPRFGLGLALFGVFLVAGLITIVGAASGEATLAPGEEPRAPQRRRAWRARAIAAGIVTALLAGGRLWWNAEDAAYARGVFRPLEGNVTVDDSAGTRRLAFTLDSTALGGRRPAPLIPDHGKMMHLFAVRADLGAIAHLHPVMRDSMHFAGTLPDVPPGRYRVFADVVRETGAAETMVGTADVRTPAGATRASDPDDATFVGAPSGARVRFADGSTLTWEGAARAIVAGTDAPLSFVVRDANGNETTVEPFLGMAGHAMLVRDSLDVFVHLHPVGTASLAAQRALLERTTADTARGALARRFLAADSAGSAHDMHGAATAHDAPLPGRFAFPYAFPKAGRYRLWVQFRRGGTVRTAPFDVAVAAR
jgi:hypothetical protein